MQKPAVVRDVDKEVRAIQNKVPNQIAHGIFETNQRCDVSVGIRKIKNGVLSARGEITGHPRARDRCEKRKGMSQRNVFAKWNEVHLAINLHALAAVGDKQRRVVIMSTLEIECTEHQIAFVRRREIRSESAALTVLIAHRVRHWTLRQDQQVGWRVARKREFAQSLALLENLAPELRIGLSPLRD